LATIPARGGPEPGWLIGKSLEAIFFYIKLAQHLIFHIYHIYQSWFMHYLEVFSMSSFTQLLLEDGVEVELPARLSDVIAMLDEDVPGFACQGHGYRLTPAKGQIGSKWDLFIRTLDLSDSEMALTTVGRIEVEKLDQDMVLFRIPPLVEQKTEEVVRTETGFRLFGSFVYQVLNSFQQRELITLPGPLPVF
jgi:hypothetical protein